MKHAQKTTMSAPITTSEQAWEELSRLEEMLQGDTSWLDPFIHARVTSDIERIRTRLDAGASHTIAVIAGGTGCGKSTFFNCLVGVNFSPAGPLRPTTRSPRACVWGSEAEKILDFLGVEKNKRLECDSHLATSGYDLDSLVLVDVPDHDSYERSNMAHVARILPMVDVIIWVLDPQKYSDAQVYIDFISQIREREENLIVVLNRIDEVPEEARSPMKKEIEEIFRAEGMENIHVIATNALTGEGVNDIREQLEEIVGRHNTDVATARAHIRAIARVLAGAVDIRKGAGEHEKAVREASQELVAHMSEACAIDAVADSLAAGARVAGGGRRVAHVVGARPQEPSASTIRAARGVYVSRVCAGLPQKWKEKIDRDIPDVEKMQKGAYAAVSTVRERGKRSWAWSVLLFFALMTGMGLGLLFANAWGVVTFSMAFAGTLTGVSALLFVLTLCVAVRSRRTSRVRRADDYRMQTEKALSEYVEKQCDNVTRGNLRAHDRLADWCRTWI